MEWSLVWAAVSGDAPRGGALHSLCDGAAGGGPAWPETADRAHERAEPFGGGGLEA